MKKIYTAAAIMLFAASSFAQALSTNLSSSSVLQVSETLITEFSIPGQVSAQVSGTAGAYNVTVEMHTFDDLTKLVAEFKLSTGAIASVVIDQVTSTVTSKVTKLDYTKAVKFIISNAGVASSTWTIKVSNAVTVQDNALSAVSMYPNPVRGQLTIANLEGVSKVYVSNVLGQVVVTKNVTDASMTINTADFKTGIYIVTVVSNKGLTRSERIVKQ